MNNLTTSLHIYSVQQKLLLKKSNTVAMFRREETDNGLMLEKTWSLPKISSSTLTLFYYNIAWGSVLHWRTKCTIFSNYQPSMVCKLCTASVYYFKLGPNKKVISNLLSFPHKSLLQNFQSIIIRWIMDVII